MKSKIACDFWPNPGKFNATILRHLSAAKGLGREARFLRRFAGATGLCPSCSGGQVRYPCLYLHELGGSLADFSALAGHIAQTSRLETEEMTHSALGATIKKSEPRLTLVWKSRQVVYHN